MYPVPGGHRQEAAPRWVKGQGAGWGRAPARLTPCPAPQTAPRWQAPPLRPTLHGSWWRSCRVAIGRWRNASPARSASTATSASCSSVATARARPVARRSAPAPSVASPSATASRSSCERGTRRPVFYKEILDLAACCLLPGAPVAPSPPSRARRREREGRFGLWQQIFNHGRGGHFPRTASAELAAWPCHPGAGSNAACSGPGPRFPNRPGRCSGVPSPPQALWRRAARLSLPGGPDLHTRWTPPCPWPQSPLQGSAPPSLPLPGPLRAQTPPRPCPAPLVLRAPAPTITPAPHSMPRPFSVPSLSPDASLAARSTGARMEAPLLGFHLGLRGRGGFPFGDL